MSTRIEVIDVLPEDFEDGSLLPPGVEVRINRAGPHGFRDQYVFIDTRLDEPEFADMDGDMLIEEMFDFCSRAAVYAGVAHTGPLIQFVSLRNEEDMERHSGEFAREIEGLTIQGLLTVPHIRRDYVIWRYLNADSLESVEAFKDGINELFDACNDSGTVFGDTSTRFVMDRCIFFRPLVAPKFPEAFRNETTDVLFHLKESDEEERCTTATLEYLISHIKPGSNPEVLWKSEIMREFIDKYANDTKNARKNPVFTYGAFKKLLTEFEDVEILEIPDELQVNIPLVDKVLEFSDLINIRGAKVKRADGQFALDEKVIVYLSTKHAGICELTPQGAQSAPGGGFAPARPQLKTAKLTSLGMIYLDGCAKVITTVQGDAKMLALHSASKRRSEAETLICGFDFETVADFTNSSLLHVYSVSYMFCKMPKLDATMDAINEAHGKKESHSSEAKVIVGADALKKFVDIITETSEGHRIIFVSFNGSAFDNLLLMNAILKHDMATVESILYTSAGLLGAKMCGNESSFFDLRRHLTGSLDLNCKEFGVRDCKTSIDHAVYQKMMNKFVNEGFAVDSNANPFYEWARTYNNGELIAYNARDVECMMNLLVKYRQQILAIPSLATVIEKGDIFQYKTLPSLVKKAWMHGFKKGFSMGHMTDDMLPLYEKLCQNRVGGRCDLFNGPYNHEEEMVSIDVCSLYPYVMAFADVWYPCGEVSKIMFGERDPNLIGFYPCVVDQSTMPESMPPFLPLKDKSGNNWNWEVARQSAVKFISTVEIDILRHHGATVLIQDNWEGLQYSKKIKGFDLFPVIIEVMKVKQEQDALKAARKTFNGALRNAAKLVMNSLSGKLNEGVHEDKIELIKTLERYAEVQGRYPHHSVVEEIDSGYLIVQYKKEILDLFGKQQNAVAAGALIYVYARAHMFEHVFSKIDRRDLDYTDTDSAHMRHSVFNKWLKDYGSKVVVPHDPRCEGVDARYVSHKLYEEGSKVPGSFENEYDDFKPDKCAGETGLAKKVYATRFLDPKTGKCSTRKRGLKGANPSKDIYVPSEEVERVLSLPPEGRFDYYCEMGSTMTVGQQFHEIIHALTGNIPGYGFCPECKEGRCPKKADPKVGVAMLCFHMQRVYKNPHAHDDPMGVPTGSNVISMHYTIKHLKLQTPQ